MRNYFTPVYILLAFLLAGMSVPLWAAQIEPGRLSGIVQVLASDSFEGRSPGGASEAKTVAYLIDQFEALGLETRLDFATLETLGNTGAVALPLTLALAAEAGHLVANDRVALLGIGSGINCQMLALQWQASRVLGKLPGDSQPVICSP